MTEQIKCPMCPVCGTAPDFIFPGLAQCWCPNDECLVFMWEPWRPALENLLHIGHIVEDAWTTVKPDEK